MILIDNLLQIVENETGIKITRDKRKKWREKLNEKWEHIRV